MALLRSLELFAPLTDDETHALAAQLIGTPFGPGDIATRQGEPSDSLYILARGQVAIFRGINEKVAGLSLSSVYRRTGIPLTAVPADDRTRINAAITANGLADAQRIVATVDKEAARLGLPPMPKPTP